MSIHFELKERIVSHFEGQLASEPQLRQDALLLHFESGLVMELQYLNNHEYSLQWLWGEAELRIDTAPLHAELATFPNHLHDADSNVFADTVTIPGLAPWINVRNLIDRLLVDPLMESN